MMAVVMAANLVSPMVSFRVVCPAVDGGSKPARDGDPIADSREALVIEGRHFSTASIEALQGCTCKGYENVTRMTIAAFPIVDATDGISMVAFSDVTTLDMIRYTYTFQQYY
jgi:hypothetical protein